MGFRKPNASSSSTRSPSPPCVIRRQPPPPTVAGPAKKTASATGSRATSKFEHKSSTKHVSFASAAAKSVATSRTQPAPATAAQMPVQDSGSATFIQYPQFDMRTNSDGGNGRFHVQGGHTTRDGATTRWHSYEASISTGDFMNANPSFQAGFVNAMVSGHSSNVSSVLNSGHPGVSGSITEIQDNSSRSGGSRHSQSTTQREHGTIAPLTNANLLRGLQPSVFLKHNISTESNAMTSISRRTQRPPSQAKSKEDKRKCGLCGVDEKTGVDIRETEFKTNVCWHCIAKTGPDEVKKWLEGVK